MSIKYYVMSELKKVLDQHEIKTVDYRPAYGGESVGVDLYNAGPKVSIPPMNDTVSIDRCKYNLLDRCKVFIPTGLKIGLPQDVAGILKERGSITKTPLILRAGVIDPGYTGEIFVNLINTHHTWWHIEEGAKLPVQLLFIPCLGALQMQEVDSIGYEHHALLSQRKHGAVGSSD